MLNEELMRRKANVKVGDLIYKGYDDFGKKIEWKVCDIYTHYIVCERKSRTGDMIRETFTWWDLVCN